MSLLIADLSEEGIGHESNEPRIGEPWLCAPLHYRGGHLSRPVERSFLLGNLPIAIFPAARVRLL